MINADKTHRTALNILKYHEDSFQTYAISVINVNFNAIRIIQCFLQTAKNCNTFNHNNFKLKGFEI